MGFPFPVVEAIFFFFFISRLMLILCFQARLLLETCREYCLEQNPSFYLIFWSLFGRISRIRACFGSSYYAFFVQILGLDWRFDVWGWKSKRFLLENAQNFGRKRNFFFLFHQVVFSWRRRWTVTWWRHHDVIKKKKNQNFFLFVCCLGILGLIVHMLELLCFC